MNKENIMTSFQSKLQQRLTKNLKQAKNGFSLVELMVVVVIIGVLSGVALPNLLGSRDKAKVSAANAAASALTTACEVAILSDVAPNADTETLRLAAALPADAVATATATLAADSCSTAVTGTGVATAGSFVGFGAKTPAVAN